MEIFALLLVFFYQFTANCLSIPPPLLGGAISKPLTLPFALAFRTINIVTVVAPHSLFKDGTRPHLCINEQKRPTSEPERRRLSLTDDALGQPKPKDLVLTLVMKVWNTVLPLRVLHVLFCLPPLNRASVHL